MRQRAAEKEQQNRELLEKRIQAVESLKSNIAASQVSSSTLPFWYCSIRVVSVAVTHTGCRSKLLNEKTTLVQTEVKEEEPVMASGKLDLLAKKAYGKDLKGPPFISKPQVVLFKDFDVGTIYKKRVVLTNIRYVPNCCRLLGVSAHLKDSVSIKFEPPGPLSTGMSCEMQAVFHPMINEDLEGEVQFATEVGPFSVPIRCTMKKCDLDVDSQFIDLGSHVVGKTVSRTLTLTNKGALATFFSLVTSECLNSKATLMTRIYNLCLQSVTSDNQRSSALMDPGELQPESENQELSEELQQEEPDGEIGPFESIKLEVVFTPTIPGEAKICCYKQIPVHVRGVAVSIPVWVVWPNIDLKICMFDHLYQDSIILQSSAGTALKLTFEVCPEMRKHMEILPKAGVIQAHSSFNAHLKFLPRCSLSKDAKTFFDRNTGVLEVPMTVQVAGQVKPVQFTVQAVVTSSDLRFDRTEVDFGYCSIYQSVKSSIRLTNQSLLLQEFGFVGLPEFIEVQPNDGFGALLPQETLEIDLIFSATKAKEYSFQLTLCTRFNDDSSCNMGVRPPLELSHSLVQFGATAVGDHSTATLYLINREINRKQSKQVFPSVIKDAAPPVAPRLFSFVLPKDSEVSITPAAGGLWPGERCLVQVTFRPRLLDQEIKDEALRLLHRAKLLAEEMEGKRRAEQEVGLHTPLQSPAARERSCQMDFKNERNFSLSHFAFIKIADVCAVCRRCVCLTLVLNPLNTLYLRLQCPAVRPSLVVISHSGPNIADFHQVAVGERVIKRITVQNISTDSLDLSSTLLDLHGAFSLLNALRRIRPGEKHTLVLSIKSILLPYESTLEVRSQKMTLEMTLRGEGVVAAVTCSHPGGDLDFGYVLEKESTSQVLFLSMYDPMYDQSPVTFISCPGTQNYSGLSVFTAAPVEGSIAPGQSQDINVTFQPDHPSLYYSDRLTIELSNKSKVCVMDLKGAASSYNLYLYGGDPLSVPIESLLPPLITIPPQPTGNKASIFI
uniref:Uncharacterized protein n=1 Tax=Mola mola TaxID=94237 RepID=A0A3Q3XH14_MOLML